jgi:hypothetical protein
MRNSTLTTIAIATLSLGALEGCVTGNVADATSKSGIQGVTVTAEGSCSGTGCPGGGTTTTTSKAGGIWVFDAYGDENGANDVQTVTPASGQEAIPLVFTNPGYQGTTVYHHPNYVQKTYNNKQYEESDVQQVYLCKVGALDSDGDGLCDDAEAAYGTNKLARDTDGDSIDDRAEVLGGSGLDLRYYGASATHKDVFIYADYYSKPIQAGLDQVVAAFAASPVSNPDGATGIKLHIILGQQIAAADTNTNIIGPLAGDWSQFDAIKNKYFPARYANYAHYVLFADRYDSGSSSGISRGIPAHDFLVTLGGWPVKYGTQLQQAGTLMHEFGHNLGLRHGGNEDRNYKPNYLSIMSYRYQVVGLEKSGTDGILDYSRFTLSGVAENNLHESWGIGVTGTTTAAQVAGYGVKLGSGLINGSITGPLDFNANGIYDPGQEAVDLDGNGVSNDVFINSLNDWQFLIYSGSATGGGAITGLDTTSAGLAPPQITPPHMMQPELDHP